MSNQKGSFTKALWPRVNSWYEKAYIDLLPLLIVVVVVSTVVFSIRYAVQEAKEWEAFKVEHECEIVSREKATSSSGFGMMANGNMGVITTTTPSKTGWLCNDGIIYIR